MAVLPTTTTGPLRRTIVEMAYGQCGIVGYEFGHTAEEVTDALYLLNAMMGEEPWSALGYKQPLNGAGDPAEASGISVTHLTAVAFSLAERICSTKGKVLSQSQQAVMSRSRMGVYAYAATIPSMPYARHTPRGAGSERLYLSPFIEETVPVDVDAS